jgi:hypothetical protein
MPEDSNIHGHLSAIPKSHKFEMSLNLTFKLMCRVFNMLVMVTDRCCSADLKKYFVSSFYFFVSRDVLAGAGVLCDGKAVLLVETTTKALCTVALLL